MNTYYIAGYPVSDELYHHGIKGQKWGIRRYQNEDGSLTPAGRARYGKELGEYSNKKQGIVRKLATGDWALGRKRIAEHFESWEGKIADKADAKGKHEYAKEIREMQKAQRQRNIDREIYMSRTSTGKLIAQNILLGAGADSYRVERKNNAKRGEAATTSILAYVGDLVITAGGVGVGGVTGAIGDMYKSKQRYGKITL